jgi:rSAM/selenodomain-associated transferase 2
MILFPVRSRTTLSEGTPAVKNKTGNKTLLSAVIPAFDAAAALPATLAALGTSVDEVVVVDGGSADSTADVARSVGARVLAAPRGRGGQLAAGIAAARHSWLLLLHADTRLAPGWASAASAHINDGAGRAGYFRFALDSADPRARRLERAVQWRCRALALPYGDQGLLIHRDLLDRVGGMRPLPVMEDVDLVRRLGRARLRALDADALTSAAKWEREGWRRRSARNLACLTLWFAGVPPRLIARAYG